MAGTIKLKAGDTETITANIVDLSGNPVNLTGKSIVFCIKRSEFDDDVDAVYLTEITSHSNPTAGQTSKEIAAGVTWLWEPGEYRWQLQLRTSGIIQSTDKGDCVIEKNMIEPTTTTTTTA
jgi:hypothetical protein